MLWSRGSIVKSYFIGWRDSGWHAYFATKYKMDMPQTGSMSCWNEENSHIQKATVDKSKNQSISTWDLPTQTQDRPQSGGFAPRSSEFVGESRTWFVHREKLILGDLGYVIEDWEDLLTIVTFFFSFKLQVACDWILVVLSYIESFLWFIHYHWKG